MYDELVKRLRERCVFLFPHHGESRSYDADLMHEAADAIEELIAKLNHADDQIARLVDAVENRRWISVEDKENLPNADSGVVGYFGGGAFNHLRWYDFVTTLSDGTIVGESTERDVTNEHCIAVYKLPEPPKEE